MTSEPWLTAIADLVAGLSATGVRVELLELGARQPLAPGGAEAAYRTVQLGLANPGAGALVGLHHESDALLVEVITESSGPAAGLAGLREQVGLAGGMVLAAAAESGGFRLAVCLPYQRRAQP